MAETHKSPRQAFWEHKLRSPAFLALLLALATFVVFLPVAKNDFVNYDDPDYVTANPHVQSGLKWNNVVWAFEGAHASNWHPLTWLSHMLDCQLFGQRTASHHLANVGWHIANAVLLLFLLRRMTGAVWRSAVVAALFALHPLHVESVAWISERKDVLSTFFFLLTLWAYVRYIAERESVERRATKTLYAPRSHAPRFYALTILFFTLGLLSKPMLVTTPFVLLLLDYWPLQRFQLSTFNSQRSSSPQPKTQNSKLKILYRLLLEKLPFFALAAASSAVTYNVQQQAVWSISYLPLAARAENALVAYCRYLGKLFWPVNLSIFYPHPGSWPAASVVLAALLLLGISALAVVFRRRAPYLAVGWFWFAGTLVPVIGLVQVGWQSIADRYTYIPFIGLFIGLVWSAEALSRWKHGKLGKWNDGMMEGEPRRAGARLMAGLALITLAVLTRQQIGYWKNSETLFTHALAVTKDNFLAHYNLGIALLGQARFDEAIIEFKEAISLRPKSGDAYNGLGEALMRQGRLDEAIELFHKAVNLRPDLAVARNNLGISLSRRGLLDQAINEFQEALKAKPDYAKAYNNLGMALQAQGRLEDAIIQLQRAVSLAPQDAEAHNNLGIALARKGLLEEAIRQLQQATRLNPKDAQAHHNLGFAFSKQGRLDEAISQLERSLDLRPDSPDTHAILGAALAKKGLRGQAITHFEQALKLRPNYPEAEQQLHALKGGDP